MAPSVVGLSLFKISSSSGTSISSTDSSLTLFVVGLLLFKLSSSETSSSSIESSLMLSVLSLCHSVFVSLMIVISESLGVSFSSSDCVGELGS